MALSLTTKPAWLSLTGNEMPFKIHSDNAFSSPGTAFSGRIRPTNYQKACGSEKVQKIFTFSWGSYSLTVRNITDTAAGDYVASSAPATTLTNLMNVLKANYYFSRDFNISFSGSVQTAQLNITAKVVGSQYHLACTIENGFTVIVNGTDKTLRDNFRIAWQVQKYNTTSWEDIGEVQLESVDENGDVEIDVSEFLQRDVAGHFSWPQIYASNMALVDITDKYRIKYMEYYGTDPVFQPVSYSTEALCMQGRVSQLRMASIVRQGLNFYTFLVNNQKPFTFAPKEKLIGPKQRELIYFYCSNKLTTLKLYVKAYYTDGTTSADTVVKTLNATSGTNFKDKIIEIFCGYSATGVGLITPAKTVFKYQVWITDASANRIMEIRTFIIDHLYCEFERYFIYRNKLGLYEMFRTTGLSYASLKTDKGFIRVPLNGNYDITERSIKQAIVDKEVTVTQNSGHIEDINIINYISEFLESADAYLCDNKYAYPITIVPGSYQLYTDKLSIFSFEFDYNFALEADSTEEFLIAAQKGSFNTSFNNSFM